MARVTAVTLGALLIVACAEVTEPAPEELGRPVPLFDNGTSDVAPPALTAFGFAPTTINTSAGSADVTVDFTVTDDLSGAMFFRVDFYSPSGGVARVGTTSFAATTSHTGSVIVSFPQFSEAGTWTLVAVIMQDAAGNVTTLSTADLADQGFPTTLTVESVQDVTAPALTALSFTPTTINTSAGPADLTVDFTVTDDLSGAVFFRVDFYSPSGSQIRVGTASFPGTTGHTGSMIVSFPQFSEAGTWTLVAAIIQDAVGNVNTLSTADLSGLGFPTTLTVESVQDVSAPALTALSFTPTTINTSAGPADLTVDFTVTDDLSGAVFFRVDFYSPSGGVVQVGTASFAAATSHTGAATVSFPQFSEAGTWTLVSVILQDAAGNVNTLSTAALARLGFPTTIVIQNTIPVAIDIKPGQAANPINLTSKGNIPVAILSAPGFDARSLVDRASLRFGRTGDEESLASCENVPRDVNGDGLADLVCQFRNSQTGFQQGDTEGVLKGMTVGGTPIEGRDAIRVL